MKRYFWKVVPTAIKTPEGWKYRNNREPTLIITT